MTAKPPTLDEVETALIGKHIAIEEYPTLTMSEAGKRRALAYCGRRLPLSCFQRLYLVRHITQDDTCRECLAAYLRAPNPKFLIEKV
jgi:hypothetical protein